MLNTLIRIEQIGVSIADVAIHANDDLIAETRRFDHTNLRTNLLHGRNNRLTQAVVAIGTQPGIDDCHAIGSKMVLHQLKKLDRCQMERNVGLVIGIHADDIIDTAPRRQPEACVFGVDVVIRMLWTG